MPDANAHHPPAPRDWSEAFAALPLDTPPANGWSALSARLDAHRRSRMPRWLAVAATLALGLCGTWWLHHPTPSPDSQPADPLEPYYAESSRLESLLAAIRDEHMGNATATLLADELDSHLASIDLALAEPDLSQQERLSLWQARVHALHTLTGIEGQQHWLAAQGTGYAATLVRVD